MMNEPSLREIETLFQAAADRPPDSRRSWLASSGAPMPVQARVVALLEALERDEALEPPVAGSSSEAEIEGPGTEVGRYTLVERIGEGGFGVVYRARQETPVTREVALKIIKQGMDTREIVARFEAERQALARMEHPSIATAFDAGTTATGRPFVVMELVRGVPITEHCDRESMPFPERLELFAEVCRAVQHAHQKGVIHRDLKPSNVLVTVHDGRAVPKVIDFGIAKALSGRLGARTLHTAEQRFLGTPAYTSPEQAFTSGTDVDTRTDIYALGVLLYELLVGTTPFEAERLARASLAEVQRILEHEEPPRPSTRIGRNTAAATVAEVSAARGVDAGTLVRRLRGDLDWIVTRALAKEPERRYAAASDLAADIERHLRDEPVLAGPPSLRYRLRKAFVRHRAAVVSAALLGVATGAGLIGTGWGLLEAERQNARARQEAFHAAAVTDFLVETLSLTDPAVALNPSVSVRALLDRTSTRLDTVFRGEARAEARLRTTVGRAYASLGENELAEAQLERALALADGDRDGVVDVDAETAIMAPGDWYRAWWALTHVRFRLDRPNGYEAAGRARGAGHDWIRRDHPDLAAALDDFVSVSSDAAHGLDRAAAAAALPRLDVALQSARDLLPAEDARWTVVADSLMSASYELWYTEHEAQSIPYLEAALDIRRRMLPPGHPDLGETVGQLATMLVRAGEPARAEETLHDAVISLRERVLPGSFALAQAESMLGESLAAQGRFAEAEPLLLESHRAIVASVGDEGSFLAADSLARVVALYDGWGRTDVADEHRRRLFEVGASGPWGLPWPLVQRAMPGRYAGLRDALERFDLAVGGLSYSSAAGTAKPEDLAALGDAIVEWVLRLPDDDPLRATVGRFLIGWCHALAWDGDQGTPTRLVDLALALIEPHAESIPLEAADGHALRARLGRLAADGPGRDGMVAVGTVARDHVDRARILVAVGADADSWLDAVVRTRIARNLAAVGRTDDARAILAESTVALARHFGAEHRQTALANGLLKALDAQPKSAS